MEAEMTTRWAERALSRILEALEREIVAMPDEEIAAVLDELGMKPAMRGSAAWADLLYFARPPEEMKGERASDDDESGRSPLSFTRGDASTRH
jgi:hypothetical protein